MIDMRKLSDLKILELCSVLAGPMVGTFFTELGATVVKVEKRDGGDITRAWKTPLEPEEAQTSAYYASANWDKRVIHLDLTNHNDHVELKKLIKESDVILVNFKLGGAEKFKLTYEHVLELNPKIIYGEITGFPVEKSRAAFDVVLQAETGYISMTGSNTDDLAKLPVAFIDLFAAHQLKEGVLVALYDDIRPSRVSVSLYEAAIASLANQASNFLMTKQVPKPIGTKHPNIAPYGDCFDTSDNNKIVLAVGNDRQFKSLLSVLSMESTEEFKTNRMRVANRTKLNALLKERILTFDSKQLMNKLNEKSVPAGLVLNLQEVFEKPQAQNLVISDEVGKRVKTTVFKIST